MTTAIIDELDGFLAHLCCVIPCVLCRRRSVPVPTGRGCVVLLAAGWKAC